MEEGKYLIDMTSAVEKEGLQKERKGRMFYDITRFWAVSISISIGNRTTKESFGVEQGIRVRFFVGVRLVSSFLTLLRCATVVEYEPDVVVQYCQKFFESSRFLLGVIQPKSY